MELLLQPEHVYSVCQKFPEQTNTYEQVDAVKSGLKPTDKMGFRQVGNQKVSKKREKEKTDEIVKNAYANVDLFGMIQFDGQLQLNFHEDPSFFLSIPWMGFVGKENVFFGNQDFLL
jgi:hypothetical protein